VREVHLVDQPDVVNHVADRWDLVPVLEPIDGVHFPDLAEVNLPDWEVRCQRDQPVDVPGIKTVSTWSEVDCVLMPQLWRTISSAHTWPANPLSPYAGTETQPISSVDFWKPLDNGGGAGYKSPALVAPALFFGVSTSLVIVGIGTWIVIVDHVRTVVAASFSVSAALGLPLQRRFVPVSAVLTFCTKEVF
jgi:hypothetical protein